MKKRLDTRFPAARIKKIMQADEDVGKIANAVPLLMSKALELFLQDLCDRTYDITLKRGAKTLNSFHLKQCVQTCNVFDFLKDIVSRVPDLGGSDTAIDNRSASKRRKIADSDDHDSDDDIKHSQTDETAPPSGGSGRGRSRVRGRGKGRAAEREYACGFLCDEKHEEDEADKNNERPEPGSEPADRKAHSADLSIEPTMRNFDLNVGLDEMGDNCVEMKRGEEYPGWSNVEGISFYPSQLANNLDKSEEAEDDYDEEG
ncbi:unnamed protein product [Cuscuta epithymum]|uniref:Transcription factor CBF/NF-Y/archaeal histone domain-containing protein n=1 Tax=Cuscuta epithymum TaxID=186058 RepID=A0AAV0DFE8_9ASTE|nr:unnamed protein product [Cuscuta epithymum]CAH9128582.1 unnamed protein product [Cuscuta epithymum]